MVNVYIVAASDTERDETRRLRWGDYWFKDSLGKALVAQGHALTGNVAEADVLINCHGMGVERLPEHTYNVLWVIGHPSRVRPAECWQYDAVYAESEQFTAHLVEQGIRCKWLPGASDMRAMPRTPKTLGKVFVGNARNGSRPCIDALKGNYSGLQVWGEGWEKLSEHVWQGAYYPNDGLNTLYASAKEVLNDQHPDMDQWGMHNPRYYDVLAVASKKVPTFADCAARIMGDMPEGRVALDLGCGKAPRRGFVGIDKLESPGVRSWDLEEGLPIGYHRADVIVADNILEHLTNCIGLMNDCHRALLPTGRMHVTVPNVIVSPEAAWSDPTHVRAFTPQTWDYFNAEHPRWQEYGKQYGILPWRVIYVRARDRFTEVMLRPTQ